MSSSELRSPEAEKQLVRHRGFAWVALCLSFAAHVVDETLTNFLSVYNPAVQAIRKHIPYLPLPTFTFEVWLAGLCLAVVVLLALTPFAFRGARWMALLSYPYGAIMFLNGLQHFAGSIYLGRAMPGVYSAPLLLGASSYLLWATAKASRR